MYTYNKVILKKSILKVIQNKSCSVLPLHRCFY